MPTDNPAAIDAAEAADVTEKNPWISTADGSRFDFENPDLISFRDIVMALGAIPRYLGHTTRPYTVAQHSVIVSKLAEHYGYGRDLQFIGLMHDAAEAYCGDVPRPLKRQLPNYNRIIERVEKMIAERFGYTYPHPGVIGELDNEVFFYERRGISRHDLVDVSDVDPPPPPIAKLMNGYWDFQKSRDRFRARFYELYTDDLPN